MISWDSLSQLAVVALASARIWRLFAVDDVTGWMREYFDYKFPRFSDFLACPWCSGFWITVVVWLAANQWSTAALISMVFATSQVAALIARAGMNKGDNL